jgi:hypothetical protein
VSIYPSFGGMDEFFPQDYSYSFKQFDYEDLTKVLNLLEDENVYQVAVQDVKNYIFNKLNKNKIDNQFLEILNI